MVGRAPGGNGCPGSLEVTALRWLRGHSWLNSWFFRGGPPRSVGSAVTTPRQGPPLENHGRHACGTAFLRRVLRHVSSLRGTSSGPLVVSRPLFSALPLFTPFPLPLRYALDANAYLSFSPSSYLTFCAALFTIISQNLRETYLAMISNMFILTHFIYKVI